MRANTNDIPDPEGAPGEIPGAERYLQPGEDLRIFSSDVQIKKFRFEAYLTNRRLFLIDQSDRNSGITAKEIPVNSIISSYLEESASREPVLVLSVKTSDDEIRTMKMVFVHTGEDRARETEEWVHLVSQAASAPGTGRAQTVETATAPGARVLSDTMVFPESRPSPPLAVRTEPPARPVPPQPVTDREKPHSPPAHTPQASGQIVYCFHCGKRLPGNANFCPFCGTRVHEERRDEESHLRLPLHQYRESHEGPVEEPQKKKGWRRFFGR